MEKTKEEIGSANLKAIKYKIAEKFNLNNSEVNLFLSVVSNIMWNKERVTKRFFSNNKSLEKLCNLNFIIAISPNVYGFHPLGYELYKKYNEVTNDALIEVNDIEL